LGALFFLQRSFCEEQTAPAMVIVQPPSRLTARDLSGM
jgi:hypothetical protein